MPRIMKFNFIDIPKESSFSIFDKENSKNTLDFRRIQPGNTSFEFTIPDEWDTPFRTLRTKGYWIPRSYMPIDEDEGIIEFNGGDYYVDINRTVLNEELNQRSVETLIHGIFGNDNLDGRQKFFISLISLQSYFEHLVYGMLVLSGYLSKTAFNNLQNHQARTTEAFSDDNNEFFTDNITICPGKESLGSIMPSNLKIEVKNIFDEIRTLRNKVVHKWGIKDISREELFDVFSNVNEHLDIHGNDEDYFNRTAIVFIKLYAKTSHIKNQLSLFNEKYMVQKERETRGYPD